MCKPMYDEFILPSKIHADIVSNSDQDSREKIINLISKKIQYFDKKNIISNKDFKIFTNIYSLLKTKYFYFGFYLWTLTHSCCMKKFRIHNRSIKKTKK